jgi:hypothetical protein
MDGRAFIRKAVHDLSIESNNTQFFSHFVMNLPATALEFLGKTLQKLIQGSFFNCLLYLFFSFKMHLEVYIKAWIYLRIHSR